MRIIDIQQAESQLSKLIDDAAKGEPLIIAKAGKPIVQVIPLNTPTNSRLRRLGFMAGQIDVPTDFDRMGRDKIERMLRARHEALAGHAPSTLPVN